MGIYCIIQYANDVKVRQRDERPYFTHITETVHITKRVLSYENAYKKP